MINKRLIVLISIMLTALIFGTGCDAFIKTNDGVVDLNWYMGLTEEEDEGDGKAFTSEFGDVAAVSTENDYAEDYAVVKDGDAFVNIKTIKSKIDDRFYWDKNENLVLFTDATHVYTTKAGESEIISDDTETVDYVISFVENKQCYVNMNFVKKFHDMDFSVSPKEDKVPARVFLQYSLDKVTVAKTSDSIEMRTKGNYQNLIVTKLDKGTDIIIDEKGSDWSKVRTKEGFIGYIPTKYIKDEKTEKSKYKTDEDSYTHVLMDEKVSLAWNQVYNQTANGNVDGLLKNTKGINVISPTWFSIDDKKGNLSSLAELDYVEKAHKKGMQVWPLVDDFKDNKITKKVLGTTKIRQQLVKNIMFFVDGYDLDGINIDFEHISEENADDYLQFLRELSVECRKAKKVLSVDNYVPSDWSAYYDRKQQYRLADYLMIMNYDEHQKGDSVAGSVSSMEYAKTAIEGTIAEVGDGDRIINGMPFYTRIWYMVPDKEDLPEDAKEGAYVEDSANGNYYLSSETLTMDEAKKAYKKAGVKPTFDEKTGQNYVTYPTPHGEAMIWLEDATSVKSRMEMMKEYKLAGVAYWSLGKETDSIWDVITDYLK